MMIAILIGVGVAAAGQLEEADALMADLTAAEVPYLSRPIWVPDADRSNRATRS